MVLNLELRCTKFKSGKGKTGCKGKAIVRVPSWYMEEFIGLREVTGKRERMVTYLKPTAYTDIRILDTKNYSLIKTDSHTCIKLGPHKHIQTQFRNTGTVSSIENPNLGF